MYNNTTRMSIAVGKHVARIRGRADKCIITTSPPSYCTKPNLLRTSQADGIRRITMTNVKTRNSLSLEMMEDLIDSITSKQEDPKLRCIILYGEGKVFSSGHNLKELTSKDGVEHHKKVFSTCTRLMVGIMESPVPVIAVVDGIAAAAGCQLVATCDIAICTENASFSTPGANLGIFCSTPGIPVGRSVPKKVAAHMLFTGLPLTAEEALRSGLVSKVIQSNKIEEEVQTIVDTILAKSRSIIAMGKKFLYQQLETDIKTAYKLGEDVMVNNLMLVDGQEGIKSFIEKRKANWTHSFEKLH